MIRKCKILFRGDTKENWLNTDPILHEREFVIETDSNRLKIGNGVNKYSELPYFFGGWQTWENDNKKHFGLSNKPILTYVPATQKTLIGEYSNVLEVGRNSSRVNVGNGVPTIQIGKNTNYLEIGKSSGDVKIGESAVRLQVGSYSQNAIFGSHSQSIRIGGGGQIIQSLQIGSLNNSGLLKISRTDSTNYVHLTPSGGELYLGKSETDDLPLDKISMGYRGVGDVLRAGASPNYYHLASDPTKNVNNRFMKVLVGEYAYNVELGSNAKFVYLGNQAEKVYLRGTDTYIDSVPNGSYGDIGGMLAVNNAGKVYKINENNFRSWLGIFDIVEMINNINTQISGINSRIDGLHPNS